MKYKTWYEVFEVFLIGTLSFLLGMSQGYDMQKDKGTEKEAAVECESLFNSQIEASESPYFVRRDDI